MTVVESLGIDFIFNGIKDVERAERARDVVNGILTGLGKLVGAAGGIYKVGGAIQDFVNNSVELENVARRTNTNVDALSAWSQALQSTGGDVNTFLGTVDNLSEAIKTSYLEGGPMRQYLHQLQVNTHDVNGQMRETTDILLGIANSPFWQRLSEQEQYFVGNRLGLDDDTIRLLQRGGDALNEMISMQRELGVVTAEQARSSRRIYLAYYELSNVWRIASNILVTMFLPAVESALTGLRDISIWVVKNKPVLYGFFIGIGTLLASVLLPILAKVAVAWAAAFGPILAVTALIAGIGAALYALYDDFVVWEQGGNAVFGGFWATVKPIVDSIRNAFSELGSFLERMWENPRAAWDEAIAAFESVKARIREMTASAEWRSLGQSAGSSFASSVLAQIDKAFADHDWDGDWATFVGRGIYSIAEGIVVTVEAISQTVQGWIEGILSTLWQRIKETISLIGPQLKQDLLDLPGNIFRSIGGWVTGTDTTPIPQGAAIPAGAGIPRGVINGINGAGRGAEVNQTMTIGSIPITVNNPRNATDITNELRNIINRESSQFFNADGAFGG